MSFIFRKIQGLSLFPVFEDLVPVPRLIVPGLIAIQDSLSDDVLMPLKSYKYQSVDKSFISRYILKHYVRITATLQEIFAE